MRYKRLVSFLLALALLAGLLPAVTLGASAADAPHTITVTVREGKDGDPRQYITTMKRRPALSRSM